MPVISVIVPVYKAEEFLTECVDSILSQTFSDFELILVDDGSPDNSGALCDEYAERDARIRVIHQRNQGQAAARNHAVNVSRAKWIHFVDSDDVIHPQMLESLYNAVVQHRSRMAMCGMVQSETMPDGFRNHVNVTCNVCSCNEELLLEYLNTNNLRYGVVWAKLIDKAIVEKYPFQKGRIYEDSAAVCNWFCEAGTLVDIQDPLYYYRVNPDSTTQSTFSVKHFDVLWSYEQQIRCYRQRQYTRMLERLCDEYIWLAHGHFIKAKEEMNEPKYAKRIAKNAKSVYHQNKEYFTLTQKQWLYIMETFYPKRMALYWRCKAFTDRVKKVFSRK